ncbi:MAG: DUF87 domain-containing protein [Lachnospiraceae bacterium]|nr:DUF87 domain-containing protein [Lachnospiraceae bacterium]
MFGVIKGSFGPFVKELMLGLFGLLAYVLPLVIIPTVFYQVFLAQKKPPAHKIAGFILLWVFLGMFLAFLGTDLEAIGIQTEVQDTFFDKLAFINKQLYADGSGGGVILGIPALIFHGLFGKGGGLFVVILFIIFSILLMAGRSFFDWVMDLLSGRGEIIRTRVNDPDEEEWPDEDELARLEEEKRLAREERRRKHIEQQREAARRKARHEEELRIQQEERERVREEKRIKKQENDRLRKEAEERAEDERILATSNPGRRRLNSSAFEAGIPDKHKFDDMHEITLLPDATEITEKDIPLNPAAAAAGTTKRIYEDEIRELKITPLADENPGTEPENDPAPEPVIRKYEVKEESKVKEEPKSTEPVEELPQKPKPSWFDEDETEGVTSIKSENEPAPLPVYEEKPATPAKQDTVADVQKTEPPKAAPAAPVVPRPYEKPNISLLKDPKKGLKADSEADLKETALLLQQTLKSFGVTATVNDISQGPSVTRFELQLGEGIKVNKIVNLADDLKLNLAAEEIRIEAPIPGKAAVGIEIPNKERIPVSLKELIESAEFKKASSKLTFVVGKDIGGRVIVADIGKMPHLLVAGTTGSGKSVFTNSIIQSILFNASPEEVKLILIDPKVVEFSVYNGIPHLLMPVVTEPRKANVALAWAVAEMSRRYKLFAEHDVRGIDAYNEQVEKGKVTDEDGNVAKKLSKIVIVVDELADLMMVAGKEVEDSICRIAQLARAAGIHLIIATQRPSVDVITGLIKANMPSRVALKCGSGVDSRTILDATGAEKLLGYGDMLFSPQGFNKPLRVQGAFVSDEEVQKVAEFLKSQTEPKEVYDQKILDEVSSLSNAPAASSDEQSAESESGDGLDEYFEKACRFVIEKEKASSGMLQRVFKIGFNRAARIIDQMEANGIVGPEEGTKPRKVMMSMEQLEAFLKERKA